MGPGRSAERNCDDDAPLFNRPDCPRPREAGERPDSAYSMHLSIVPDRSHILFVLVDDGSVVCELVPPSRFLDTLRALSAAMGFGPACSTPVDPAELLPWAGNV